MNAQLFNAQTAQEVDQAVEAGADVNSVWHHDTPLIKACLNGNLEVAQSLLQHGANPNYVNDLNCYSALMFATQYYHREIIDLLLKQEGILINSNGMNASPLVIACGAGRTDLIDLFLEHGADVNSEDDTSGYSPLMTACSTDSIDVVDRLLNNGANVNAIDMCGSTALTEAAEKGCVAIVERLLFFGADVHQVPSYMKNALYNACSKGHSEVASRLIACGADVNFEGPNQKTPLMAACRRNNARLVQILLEAGADPEAKDENGRKPCDFTFSEEVKELLRERSKIKLS